MVSKLKIGVFLLFLMLMINFGSAETYKVNTDNNVQFICTVNNQVPTASATYNISVYYQNGTTLLNNVQAEAQGQGSFNYTINFPSLGIYKIKSFCYDTAGNFSSETLIDVTPTGNKIEDVGQISVGIIYFFLALGLGIIGLGYLFLRNDSVWISYSGLFLMLIGATFLYYDLHLTNLYASTIAVNSGAENVTTGVFVMVANFLKLTPLFIAGIIAFSAVRVLRQAVKKKRDSDGWDNNAY